MEKESARLAPAAEVNGKLQFSRHFTLHPLRLSSAATATPAANKRWGWSATKRAGLLTETEREHEKERGTERDRERDARQGLKSNSNLKLSLTAVRQVSCVSLPAACSVAS